MGTHSRICRMERSAACDARSRRWHDHRHHRRGTVYPVPIFGNVTAGGAALRNWALNLGTALEADESGVHIAHVAIGVRITDQARRASPA